jgi:hypothetical protein
MDETPATAPYPVSFAVNKYERLTSRSLVQFLLGLFHQNPSETLLSFDQIQQLLKNRTEVDRGTQLIPLDHIVGSVGRYRDFDRAFLPLSGADEVRWQRLDVAMNELRDLPPIDVYKVGDVYFVRDGNHRVSVAKANGLTHIEANVTEVDTVVPLTADINVDDLIIKTEYAEFQKATHLNETRPEVDIRLTEPGRYRILCEHIEVHRYYLGIEWHRPVSLEEAAAHWYDTVYLPVVEAIRSTDVLREFPQRTEADLYLWVSYHRERLRERYGVTLPNEEVANVLKERFSGRPVGRLIKTVHRALRAAVNAVTESPEPPDEVEIPPVETTTSRETGGPLP